MSRIFVAFLLLITECIIFLNTFYDDAETARMVERLVLIAPDQDPNINGYLSDQRVSLLAQSWSDERPMGQQITDRFLLARELVRANRNVEAITLMEQIKAVIQPIPKENLKAMVREFDNLYDLAWLRSGEQENCVLNHTSGSCLFPIGGNGTHALIRGSTEAGKILWAHLKVDPGDQKSRWMLNIGA